MRILIQPVHKAPTARKPSKYKPVGLGRHRHVQAVSKGAGSTWARCCHLPESLHLSAAEDMAAALLNAQGDNLTCTDSPPEIAMAPGRGLYGPGSLSDEALSYYMELLAPTAFGRPSKIPAPSPCLVPYLLGGMTVSSVEKLAVRAVRLIGVDEPESDTLSDALLLVGYGHGSYHSDLLPVHNLARKPEETYDQFIARTQRAKGETPTDYLKRLGGFVPDDKGADGLNIRQRYLYTQVPFGKTFAESLLAKPPYDGSLRERVMKHKLKAITSTAALFQEESGEMPEVGFKRVKGDRSVMQYLDDTRVTDHTFNRAVHMVFDEPWANLDLDGDLEHDVEVMLARQLILCFVGNRTRPAYMTGATLVGISVLTGISMAKWVEYALIDVRRRGETFISSQGIRDAIEVVQFSDYGHLFDCEPKLLEQALMLQELERYQGLATRLRKVKQPFWSTRPLDYYVKSWLIDQGEVKIKYKHRIEVLDR